MWDAVNRSSELYVWSPRDNKWESCLLIQDTCKCRIQLVLFMSNKCVKVHVNCIDIYFCLIVPHNRRTMSVNERCIENIYYFDMINPFTVLFMTNEWIQYNMCVKSHLKKNPSHQNRASADPRIPRKYSQFRTAGHFWRCKGEMQGSRLGRLLCYYFWWWTSLAHRFCHSIGHCHLWHSAPEAQPALQDQVSRDL